MDGIGVQSEEVMEPGGGAKPQRGEMRDSTFLSAQLAFPYSTTPMTVRIRNISPGGMMIDFSGSAPVGELMVAEIKGIGMVQGKVAWIGGGRMGVCFDREIDPQMARIKVSDMGPRAGYANHRPSERRPGLAIR